MGHRPFQADLSGRLALVTGANSGMGKESARELARMGAQVILACGRNQLGEAAANDIIETTGHTGVTVMQVDLSSPASVRALISTGRGYRHGGCCRRTGRVVR